MSVHIIYEIYVCMHMYVYVYIYMYICVCTCICFYVYVHVFPLTSSFGNGLNGRHDMKLFCHLLSPACLRLRHLSSGKKATWNASSL